MKIFNCITISSVVLSALNAQSINISEFYYRDFLDFGQNKGIFGNANNANGITITKKDGTALQIPNTPNFSASSNYGSLTSIGRGFTVTANHVESANTADELLKWGLTNYTMANSEDTGTSSPYGSDVKFLRFGKYIIEGQAEMLDMANSTKNGDKIDEGQNLIQFKNELENFKDKDGNIYLYQAGSGIVTLRNSSQTLTQFNTNSSGDLKGGGFGTLNMEGINYQNLINCSDNCDTRGISFNYKPNSSFQNIITSGDSGSGIYAYDSNNKKWILLGVTSQTFIQIGGDEAKVSFASNKDFLDYQSKFEQKINLKIQDPASANKWTLNNNTLTYEKRGDTPNESHTLQGNKDLIFSGGGNIEVKSNIYRNVSGYAGGFVFEGADSKTTYAFTNESGKNYFFKGSGLDIGENVVVEWALRNESGDSLHKIGKGELVVKTDYTLDSTKNENLGTLKIGEGKVTLDTDKKAYENIYIASGRGELALKKDKAQALGTTKNTNNNGSTTTNILSQDSTSNMGFYFGSGGGKLDLGGNNLRVNTIAANDSNAIIVNSDSTTATLRIQGFGYDSSGNKQTDKKVNTIIHASIGDIGDTNATNIDIVYKGENGTTTLNSWHSEESKSVDLVDSSLSTKAKNDNIEANVALVFDGNINTKGTLTAGNANIALQGHATTHAIISDEKIREQVKNAENATQKGLLDSMDLSKPSTLNQQNWDNRSFKFDNGITLNNANLTLGRNATLESNITTSNNSKITLGGNVLHFIDNKDGANVVGNGFSYQQKVESGILSEDMQNLANQSIHYKGKITADGGEVESHIIDFNASLDLKNNAKLNADYLTLEKSNTIKLDSGSSADVKTLKLSGISDGDLSTIFNTSSNKLKVTKALWFDNISSAFDLSKLDSANVDVASNYDILASNKSSITGTSKDISANISLYDESNLGLKNLILKKIDDSNIGTKNEVYLSGDSTQTNATKLTLSENLKAENLESANITLLGKSEISAQSIEFDNVKNGILLLDSEAKLTSTSGNANVALKGKDSVLGIYLSGEKSFDINANGGSNVILSEAKNLIGENVDSSLANSLKNGKNDALSNDNANFSGKISANDSSVVATALDSITASVDLSGNASLIAQNIMLDSTHNSIALKDSANLIAHTITAKNLSTLTLSQDNGAVANIGAFIFDGGSTNLTGNLIGNDIWLKNASIVKIDDLEFKNKQNATLWLDNDSKLEITNLKVDNGNLALNFANSKTNAEKISNITLSNGANLSINAWDFSNSTNFKGENNSRINFINATYKQGDSTKSINADSTISGTLALLDVGKVATTQDTQTTANSGALNFESLKFESNNLTFDTNASISVNFSNSVKKDENLAMNSYYTVLSAGSITDNRTDKRIDFTFCEGCEKLFVVSKFIDDKLQIKFLESAPNSFSELNKQIAHTSSKYSEILQVLIEHNQNDESIDIATRTEDYNALNKRISDIDNAMSEIAQGNKVQQTRNLLFSNDQTINTRVSQVRLAQRSEKHLLFAHNDAMYRIQSLMQNAVRSDAMPSYASKRENLQNSVWLNVGGGYFGGDSKMGFGATNIGYDRLINGANGDVLLGAMLGFGGSKATGTINENALFYNVGLYLHSLFAAQGKQYGGHELQGNLSFTISDNNKSYDSQSAKNTAFGTLFALYYKYNFIVAQNDTISHAVKPIVLISVGYNRNGKIDLGIYTQKAHNNTNFSYGFGLEYNAATSDSFYSIALTLKDMMWCDEKSAYLSLSGARNFIGYSIESAPRFSAELNLVGSHKITSAFYLQYGIAGVVDSGNNYGVKGDIKFGYKF